MLGHAQPVAAREGEAPRKRLEGRASHRPLGVRIDPEQVARDAFRLDLAEAAPGKAGEFGEGLGVSWRTLDFDLRGGGVGHRISGERDGGWRESGSR
jgi:hypothetical protein